jgi:hypothetical protein
MCGKEENNENVDHISHVKIFLWEVLPHPKMFQYHNIFI